MSLSPPHFIHPTPPSPSPFIPMRPPFPYRGLSFLPSIKPPLRTRTIMTAMSSSPSVPGYALRQRRFAPLNPEKRGESDAPSLGGIVFDVDGTLWYFHYLFYRFIPTWLIKKQFTPTPHVHWNAVCSYPMPRGDSCTHNKQNWMNDAVPPWASTNQSISSTTSATCLPPKPASKQPTRSRLSSARPCAHSSRSRDWLSWWIIYRGGGCRGRFVRGILSMFPFSCSCLLRAGQWVN